MGSQHTEGPSTHSVGRLDLRNTTLGVVSPASGPTAVHAKQLWPRALWVQEGFPEQGSSKPCRYPLPSMPSRDLNFDSKGKSKWSLTRIFPSKAEMISPIILTRSSYLYVLSVSHTASRIVRISLLMNLEC